MGDKQSLHSRSLAGGDSEKQSLLASDLLAADKGGGPATNHNTQHVSLFQQSATLFIISYYAFCSSTMLIFNKLAIFYLPAPMYVLTAQMAFCACSIKLLSLLKVIGPVELEWHKVKAFFPVACLFLLTLFTNIKALQHCNVETFITFRSSTPLVLSFLDYLFLGRSLPNLRSWGCLAVLVIGSAGYALTDSSFSVLGYSYLVAWYVTFCVDMVFIKYVTDSVKMTNWARAFYQNLLALVPLAIGMAVCNEHALVASRGGRRDGRVNGLDCSPGFGCWVYLCG